MYLSSDEAAAALGVSRRQLTRYMEMGLIQPVREPGKAIAPNANQYDPNDVYALKKMKAEGPSLSKTTVMAQKAYLQSKQHTRLINWLMSVMGVNGALLSLEEEEVQALHNKVERELERRTFRYSTEEVFEWARTFHLMGEEYMEALTLFLDLAQPWQLYSRLAATMLKHRPTTGDPELLAAYKCLDVSRRDLRRAGFTYAYDTFGKNSAYALFPESRGDFHQKVMSSILLHDRLRAATPGKRAPCNPDT